MNLQVGKSVGGIIRDENGRFLVVYRLRDPRGLALPAGHVEPGEVPEETLRREILEETGLETSRMTFGTRMFVPIACGEEHDGHDWWVYEVEIEGEPKLEEPDKHKFVQFMSIEDMRSYMDRGEVDPSWFTHILPQLGLL